MGYTHYKTLIMNCYKLSLLTSGIKDMTTSLQIPEEPFYTFAVHYSKHQSLSLSEQAHCPKTHKNEG